MCSPFPIRGQRNQGEDLPTWPGNPHPNFWFSKRFSLAAASFSRSSSRCRKAMGLMTSAATGSSLVPASGRGAQT